MIAVKTEALTYIYSPGTPFQKTAVDSVSVEIEQGEFVGVIGHTGSGKSTLIQHLNGLLEPTVGKVYINGVDIFADRQRLREVRFQVGLVFQYPEHQLFEDTVYKDIAFGPRNMGLSEEEIHRAVVEAAAFVGLSERHMEKSPFELSGGQKRRVAIAGVIAMKPSVLVLDEPTAGLDPRGRDRILGQLREYHQQVKNTVLLVSHSMEDISKFSSRVLVMNQGKLFLYDEPRAVFQRAAEISEMGLSVPQITEIFQKLLALGYPVNPSIYTIEDAKAELLSLLSKRGPA